MVLGGREEDTHPGKLLHEVRVLLAHVLGVAAEHSDGAVFELVNLQRARQPLRLR